MPAEQFANAAETTLNGAINALTTSVTVHASASVGFPITGQFRVRIDTEIMLVTALAGGDQANWTVVRAYEPVAGVQIAANHLDGAAVVCLFTAGSVPKVDDARFSDARAPTGAAG